MARFSGVPTGMNRQAAGIEDPRWRIALAGVAWLVAVHLGGSEEWVPALPESETAELSEAARTCLQNADLMFARKQWKQASAAYEAFVHTFPQSNVVPYALMRKGRCLHLKCKRYTAVRSYREVLDCFPDRVNYAAPAAYLVGLCYWDNGDAEKALKAWARLVRDERYRRHRVAALREVMRRYRNSEEACTAHEALCAEGFPR